MEASLLEQLLKRIQKLEVAEASLKQELCKTILDDTRPYSGYVNQEHQSISPQWPRLADPRAKVQDGTWCRKNSGSSGHSYWLSRDSRRYCDTPIPKSGVGSRRVAVDFFTERQCLNILQSMGQSVYVFDSAGQIIYWNRSSEILYGYSVLEALGQNVLQLLVCDRYKDEARQVINRNSLGETWSGTIPVKNKLGKRFAIFVTNSPFYDDKGNFLGIVGVVVDSQSFLRKMPFPSLETCPSSRQPKNVTSVKDCIDSEEPLHVEVSAKIWNMASKITNKVRLKLKTNGRDGRYFDQGFSENILSNHTESATSSEAGSLGGGTLPSEKVSREFSRESGSEGGAESWINKKRMGWSWKGSELGILAERTNHGLFSWRNCKKADEFDHQNTSDSSTEPEVKVMESNRSGEEVSGSRFTTINASSTSSGQCTSSTSTSSGPPDKFGIGADTLHYDIPWEDLRICEQIGRGSCGTVYHGVWCGSDVAVKVFSKFDFSDDLLHSFRQEFSGSLFQLLKNTALDWRRRVLMALDIAQGMNYLHLCNPPIIHRDLKSSNLFVDKNWTVKVGDFGLSRIKHSTFLTTKSGNGTPQWMAPEVMRDEPSDEKSDVYSFGVILWELATQKIPWDTLTSFQVIGTVAYMDQRLEMGEVTDTHWASLIQSCWNSEPKSRPTFMELLEKLKAIQKHYVVQRPKESSH